MHPRSELRATLAEVQGPVCGAPNCKDPWEEMAHIEPRGMGGRKSADTLENVVGLCRFHHDVFDGRRMDGRQRLLRDLMAAYVNHL